MIWNCQITASVASLAILTTFTIIHCKARTTKKTYSNGRENVTKNCVDLHDKNFCSLQDVKQADEVVVGRKDVGYVPMFSKPGKSKCKKYVERGAKGKIVNIYGEKNIWYKIVTELYGVGWVSGKNVKKIKYLRYSFPQFKLEDILVTEERCMNWIKRKRKYCLSKMYNRVGTWNLFSLPSGTKIISNRNGRKTNVNWIACQLATANLDLVALQGIENSDEATLKIKKIIVLMEKYTGEKWKMYLNNDKKEEMRIGFLYNTKKMIVKEVKNIKYRKGDMIIYSLYIDYYDGPDFYYVTFNVSIENVDRKYKNENYINLLLSYIDELKKMNGDKDVLIGGSWNTIMVKKIAKKYHNTKKLEEVVLIKRVQIV